MFENLILRHFKVGKLLKYCLQYSDSECAADEFNCEDATCISIDLKCNGRFNCRFRWDEDDCDVSTTTSSSTTHSSTTLSNKRYKHL